MNAPEPVLRKRYLCACLPGAIEGNAPPCRLTAQVAAGVLNTKMAAMMITTRFIVLHTACETSVDGPWTQAKEASQVGELCGAALRSNGACYRMLTLRRNIGYPWPMARPDISLDYTLAQQTTHSDGATSPLNLALSTCSANPACFVSLSGSVHPSLWYPAVRSWQPFAGKRLDDITTSLLEASCFARATDERRRTSPME